MRTITTSCDSVATGRIRFAALLVSALIVISAPWAGTVAAMSVTYVAFSETFDTDAANLAAVEAAYPLMSGLVPSVSCGTLADVDAERNLSTFSSTGETSHLERQRLYWNSSNWLTEWSESYSSNTTLPN